MDDGNYGCGISVDFQKVFNTVDYVILLEKLEHHDIRGISNKCFASYLANKNQFALIKVFNSTLAETICGVLQGSLLGPLLFLVYINDLHCAIKYCKIHHFAGDTNLMNFQPLSKGLINK